MKEQPTCSYMHQACDVIEATVHLLKVGGTGQTCQET